MQNSRIQAISQTGLHADFNYVSASSGDVAHLHLNVAGLIKSRFTLNRTELEHLHFMLSMASMEAEQQLSVASQSCD
jgi:hypothetical protein